ncbi:hypothetical protein OAK24_02240 [Flavobacteriales bacterium]|nr:hypothetical protein [Flavobacteriales bacterium]
MKKIVFSFILVFLGSLFVPQSSFSQVVVKSRQNKRIKKVTVKNPNKYQAIRVKNYSARPHSARVVTVKPNRPNVVVNRPNRIRRNHIWVEGHWKWSGFYGEYIWIKGRWIRQRKGYHWVSGFWEISLGGFIWVDGYWAL